MMLHRDKLPNWVMSGPGAKGIDAAFRTGHGKTRRFGGIHQLHARIPVRANAVQCVEVIRPFKSLSCQNPCKNETVRTFEE
jgi:hypothetical protein